MNEKRSRKFIDLPRSSVDMWQDQGSNPNPNLLPLIPVFFIPCYQITLFNLLFSSMMISLILTITITFSYDSYHQIQLGLRVQRIRKKKVLKIYMTMWLFHSSMEWCNMQNPIWILTEDGFPVPNTTICTKEVSIQFPAGKSRSYTRKMEPQKC